MISGRFICPESASCDTLVRWLSLSLIVILMPRSALTFSYFREHKHCNFRRWKCSPHDWKEPSASLLRCSLLAVTPTAQAITPYFPTEEPPNCPAHSPAPLVKMRSPTSGEGAGLTTPNRSGDACQQKAPKETDAFSFHSSPSLTSVMTARLWSCCLFEAPSSFVSLFHWLLMDVPVGWNLEVDTLIMLRCPLMGAEAASKNKRCIYQQMIMWTRGGPRAP